MHTTKVIKRSAAHGLVMLLLCGCGAAGTEALPERVDPLPTSNAVAIPGKAPDHGARRSLPAPPLPENSREMLAALSHEDRKLVESFYGQFGDSVFDFDNAKELEWMQRHGYPLPSDIMAASRLTDQELQSRFDSGDAKAGFFLLTRLSARAEGQGWLEARQMANQLLSMGGPFAGYAYYRYFREVKGEWARALAGLLWADYQGDWRALNYFMTLSKSPSPYGEQLSSGSVAIAYQALLTNVKVRNGTLLSHRVDPLIIYRTEYHDASRPDR